MQPQASPQRANNRLHLHSNSFGRLAPHSQWTCLGISFQMKKNGDRADQTGSEFRNSAGCCRRYCTVVCKDTFIFSWFVYRLPSCFHTNHYLPQLLPGRRKSPRQLCPSMDFSSNILCVSIRNKETTQMGRLLDMIRVPGAEFWFSPWLLLDDQPMHALIDWTPMAPLASRPAFGKASCHSEKWEGWSHSHCRSSNLKQGNACSRPYCVNEIKRRERA